VAYYLQYNATSYRKIIEWLTQNLQARKPCLLNIRPIIQSQIKNKLKFRRCAKYIMQKYNFTLYLVRIWHLVCHSEKKTIFLEHGSEENVWSKRDDVIRLWRKSHYKVLYNFYPSLSAASAANSSNIEQSGYVKFTRMTQEVWSEKLKATEDPVWGPRREKVKLTL
jgi:hypothetical protein